MRGLPGPNGQRDPVEQRIFYPSGQYDPLNPDQAIMAAPATSYNVTQLQPFTVYEFQVLAQNEVGRASSPWTAGRTQETCKLWLVFFRCRWLTKWMCVSVRMSVYVCVLCMCACVHVCVCMSDYMGVCMCVCMCAFLCRLCVYVCVCVCAFLCRWCVCVCVCVCVCATDYRL